MATRDSERDFATGLLTDLYELTMACGYQKSRVHNRQAAFHLFFRRPPFGGGYAIACGLEPAVRALERFRYTEDDIEYLRGLQAGGQALFDEAFLRDLQNFRLTCDVDAVPEGTVVFGYEPLLRVSGPIQECQLVETLLLNILNFQTLIATKASRVCYAAAGDTVLEFGLRRAQGIDGGISASRAAFIGGCDGTSNVLAGKLFDIPVRGTHAHSWVMFFDDEQEAFRRYAEAMPHNCVLLVDTYDTLAAVHKAVEVGRQLQPRGFRLAGIRLDSGDLVSLSQQARRILDAAGMTDTAIVASGDLDEFEIARLKQAGAAIGIWGVGTRLVTGYSDPALGGVYKLTAIRESADAPWRPRLKLSEDFVKTSLPGLLQVRRFLKDGRMTGDAVFDESRPVEDFCPLIDVTDPDGGRVIVESDHSEDLLQPVIRSGRLICDLPRPACIRKRVQQQLASLPDGVRRLKSADRYPVGLTKSLYQTKTALAASMRKEKA